MADERNPNQMGSQDERKQGQQTQDNPKNRQQGQDQANRQQQDFIHWGGQPAAPFSCGRPASAGRREDGP